MSNQNVLTTPSKKNKITAVITAYNAERFISRSIDSVINQKGEECDIIVVNDASTDDTAKVVKEYGDRVKYIELKENRGPAVGRTVGLFETDTDFVAFLDSDDCWKEDFARVMKNFLRSHPEAVAANSGYVSIDYNGETKFQPQLTKEDQKYYKDGALCENFYEFWAKYNCVRTGTVLMRTQVAQKTGGQREDLRLTEDLEFWGYLATFSRWGFVPANLFVTDQQILTPSERLEKFNKRFSFFKELKLQKWSRRIEPALSDSLSIRAFDEFLKNIATTIAFAKAYSFSFRDAYRFSKNNKDYIHSNGWGKAIRLGLKLGPLGWPFVCVGLRLREILKAYTNPAIKHLKCILDFKA
ncbi:glycosyltransferase family 2 protein [Balneolaceae bacterium YR4-1]|uniref:Glycosyltransferase family 2 protein n=1 Tax=Halalkalibaculum roseum TaxID=2709311 RepID=A0A6M1T6Q8_9BACT|nr:glycosyltransferase family 2 protein [Halalkalibaculum roseum]NGP75943.1 glycosyltransferase family 2 protein [Halalkalibaculum roseum]